MCSFLSVDYIIFKNDSLFLKSQFSKNFRGSVPNLKEKLDLVFLFKIILP
jgi:hypothetical protein